MNSTQSHLLVKPDFSRKEYITVAPQIAGWKD
jgi:hypothetical protein